jgi:hypothetical protein
MMWKLHYIDKIRPAGTTSALLFGSAMDKGCEAYMLRRNKQEARDLFRNTWNEQEINGTLTDLSVCTTIEFHDNDYDRELLLESDNELILKDTVYATVTDLIEAGVEKERIAYCNWISLYRKGQLMLRSFIQWVDENVAEVLGAQVPIELEDEDGNKVPGFADFVIKVHGYDNPILVDLKTAARPYYKDSVKESEQLALYYLYLKSTTYPDMERAAFLVLSKQIKKNRVKTCQKCGTVTSGREKTCANEVDGVRCKGEFTEVINPECNIQYIHDEIEQEFIDATVKKFNIAVEKIKSGVFEKNLAGCDRYYGRICPYKQYCLTGCMSGLYKKEETNE